MPHLVRQSDAGVAGCCMPVALDALNGRQPLEGIPPPVLLHVCSLSTPSVTCLGQGHEATLPRRQTERVGSVYFIY